jgi:hypothetical protein
MKFKDIKTTPEEVLQFLKDAGVEFVSPGDADYDTLKELQEHFTQRAVLLSTIYDIAVELDAREIQNAKVVDEFQQLSWNDLCDKGIQILEKLKT